MSSPPTTSMSSTPSLTSEVSDTSTVITIPDDTTDPLISTTDLELVVAHYNEDLEWLSDYATLCSIYSKGTTLSSDQAGAFCQATSLSNIGRETHTYLTHIVRNYDSLSRVTVLLQGDIHSTNQGTPEHTDLPLTEIVSQAMQLQGTSRCLGIGRHHTFSDWDGIRYLPGWIERRGNGLKCTETTPGDFWRWMFQSTPPEKVGFVQGALFAVTDTAIRRRPKAFYERVLAYFENLDEVNPEEGHYMERFWYAILSDSAVDVVERQSLGDVFHHDRHPKVRSSIIAEGDEAGLYVVDT